MIPPKPPIWIPGLDEGVAAYVAVLRLHGVETYESCEGGEGHSYPEPSVRFHGGPSEGFRALAAALTFAHPVDALHRHWQMTDGEPTGPQWELVYRRKATEDEEGGARWAEKMAAIWMPAQAEAERS